MTLHPTHVSFHLSLEQLKAQSSANNKLLKKEHFTATARKKYRKTK